jgi:hypothetical protein
LCVEQDGLMLAPVELPYRRGTVATLFKFKPHDRNTVDFKVLLVPDSADATVMVRHLQLIRSDELVEIGDARCAERTVRWSRCLLPIPNFDICLHR